MSGNPTYHYSPPHGRPARVVVCFVAAMESAGSCHCGPAAVAPAGSNTPTIPTVGDPSVKHPPPPTPTATDHWYTVQKNEQVEVQVARSLYERQGSEHFFIRVRVNNRSDRPLGIDLRDYWTVIYPNQWGPLPQDHRTAIDERRASPKVMDAARCADLRESFAKHTLRTIAPAAATEYFREFNGSSRKEVDEQATERFLFVSLAGQSLVTDGVGCMNLSAGPLGDSDLIIAAPVRWGIVPASATVVDPSQVHHVARSPAGTALVELAGRTTGLSPGDDQQCAGDPKHPHFWSYQPHESVREVVEQLRTLCIAIGPHRGMNIARWCCPPALPTQP